MPQVARRETATSVLGLVSTGTGAVVVLLALYLGFSIEATPQAVADSAKGHQIAVPAVVAFVTGVVALAGRRHGWALVVAGVGVVAAVVAVLLTVLLPGGDY
jgi:hypothetical protein